MDTNYDTNKQTRKQHWQTIDLPRSMFGEYNFAFGEKRKNGRKDGKSDIYRWVPHLKNDIETYQSLNLFLSFQKQTTLND